MQPVTLVGFAKNLAFFVFFLRNILRFHALSSPFQDGQVPKTTILNWRIFLNFVEFDALKNETKAAIIAAAGTFLYENRMTWSKFTFSFRSQFSPPLFLECPSVSVAFFPLTSIGESWARLFCGTDTGISLWGPTTSEKNLLKRNKLKSREKSCVCYLSLFARN